MNEPRILLTNDDGIDSVGFRALYDGLAAVGDVVAVAPAADQSAVGRTMSQSVDVEDHDLGYAVAGTPVDCVVAGLGVLCPDVDLVVSGCNKGGNMGAYVLGRSGTVSAAVEAAFFGVPAVSVSLYIEGGDDWASLATDPADFETAAAATRHLVAGTRGAGIFEAADYLNVNVPFADNSAVDGTPEMRVTRPSMRYEMGAERDGDRVELRDNIWSLLADGDLTDPAGTDRRTVAEGAISVSPLTAPHSTEHHAALDDLAAGFDPESSTT
jgi:5'-nucleotidase